MKVRRKKAFLGSLASAVIGAGISIWNANKQDRANKEMIDKQRQNESMNNALTQNNNLNNVINNDTSENDYAKQALFKCGGQSRLRHAKMGCAFRRK